MARANILVAAHGAGLAHSLFLPPEAVVVEVTWPRGKWPPHYRNLARYLGRHYMLVEGEGKALVRSDCTQVALNMLFVGLRQRASARNCSDCCWRI